MFQFKADPTQAMVDRREVNRHWIGRKVWVGLNVMFTADP